MNFRRILIGCISTTLLNLSLPALATTCVPGVACDPTVGGAPNRNEGLESGAVILATAFVGFGLWHFYQTMEEGSVVGAEALLEQENPPRNYRFSFAPAGVNSSGVALRFEYRF